MVKIGVLKGEFQKSYGKKAAVQWVLCMFFRCMRSSVATETFFSKNHVTLTCIVVTIEMTQQLT